MSQVPLARTCSREKQLRNEKNIATQRAIALSVTKRNYARQEMYYRSSPETPESALHPLSLSLSHCFYTPPPPTCASRRDGSEKRFTPDWMRGLRAEIVESIVDTRSNRENVICATKMVFFLHFQFFQRSITTSYGTIFFIYFSLSHKSRTSDIFFFLIRAKFGARVAEEKKK